MKIVDIENITFQKIKVDNMTYFRDMVTNELYMKTHYELVQVYGNKLFFENVEDWLKMNKVSDE